MQGAKTLVAQHGLQRANMVDIADTSEVSRATLYNHFRDKSSVMRALLESEVERLTHIADGDLSTEAVLTLISVEISRDPALATLRSTDPGVVTTMLSAVDNPPWIQIRAALQHLVDSPVLADLIQCWLVAQVTQPLSKIQSEDQARILLSNK